MAVWLPSWPYSPLWPLVGAFGVLHGTTVEWKKYQEQGRTKWQPSNQSAKLLIKKEETKYYFNNKPPLPLTAVAKGIALFKWCHTVWQENLPKGIAKEYNSNTWSRCEGGINQNQLWGLPEQVSLTAARRWIPRPRSIRLTCTCNVSHQGIALITTVGGCLSECCSIEMTNLAIGWVNQCVTAYN